MFEPAVSLLVRSLRRRWRRLVFALLPLVVLCGVATLGLSQWELWRGRPIERVDDGALYAPANFLIRDGDVYRLKHPAIIPQTVTVAKPADTVRFVFVGESYMMGTPYVVAPRGGIGFGGIPDWTQAKLAARYPSRRIEAINAAAGGVLSQAVVGIAATMLAVRPDFLVVATGNNEGFVPVTGLNDHMHQWVVYRALKRALLSDPSLAQRPYLAPQSPNPDKIQQLFERHIRKIVETAEANGVEVVLCTMPINLRYQDLAPLPDEEALRRGHALMLERRYYQAIAEFAKSRYQARAAAFIGDCLAALGRHKDAQISYKNAAQLNPLNRTRPSLNALLRSIAAEKRLLLADVEKVVEEAAPHGIPDEELFCDYCHMTWRGYELAARTIVQTLIDNQRIAGSPGEPWVEPSAAETIAQRHWEALLDEAYERRMCSRPFGGAVVDANTPR